MDEKAKLTAILFGGYLLGRTKKAKLALTVAGLIGGRQLSSNKGGLMSQMNELAKSSPEVRKLREQVTGKLADAAKGAAKGAAMAGATKGIESVNANLQNRTQQLNSSQESSDHDDDGQQAVDESPEDAEMTTSGKTTNGKSSSN